MKDIIERVCVTHILRNILHMWPKADMGFSRKASMAAAMAKLDDAKAYLIANGLTRANQHICYPNGIYQTPGT
ncbi:hypothetical protein AJ87_05100 [Rhizobium yanglingense]|nr:hypothetical protein AJ87_05100 [Rhizobium yanglingense]